MLTVVAHSGQDRVRPMMSPASDAASRARWCSATGCSADRVPLLNMFISPDTLASACASEELQTRTRSSWAAVNSGDFECGLRDRSATIGGCWDSEAWRAKHRILRSEKLPCQEAVVIRVG